MAVTQRPLGASLGHPTCLARPISGLGIDSPRPMPPFLSLQGTCWVPDLVSPLKDEGLGLCFSPKNSLGIPGLSLGSSLAHWAGSVVCLLYLFTPTCGLQGGLLVITMICTSMGRSRWPESSWGHSSHPIYRGAGAAVSETGTRARWMGWARVPLGHLLPSEVGRAQVPGTEWTTSGQPLAMLLSFRELKEKNWHICWSYIFFTALSSGPSSGRTWARVRGPGKCGDAWSLGTGRE